MQAKSPLSRYQKALNTGKYQADEVQRQVVAQLEHIYHGPKKSTSGEHASRLGKSTKTTQQRSMKRLYM